MQTPAFPMTRHGFDCCVSNNRVPCERSEQNASTLNVRDKLSQLLTQLYRACRVSEASRTFPNKRCTKYRIHFGANKPANCRGKITPTAVVYVVHTLYIHVWILPLSAKLVHSELLLTHKLATVNLWLLIAAYEQSLICYRANIHTFLAHIPANIC